METQQHRALIPNKLIFEKYFTNFREQRPPEKWSSMKLEVTTRDTASSVHWQCLALTSQSISEMDTDRTVLFNRDHWIRSNPCVRFLQLIALWWQSAKRHGWAALDIPRGATEDWQAHEWFPFIIHDLRFPTVGERHACLMVRRAGQFSTE